MHIAVPRRAREAREIHPLTARNRMPAIGFISSILADEMKKVLWRGFRGRHQSSDVHEQAAIAIEHDHPLVRPPERQPQPVRGCQSHGAMREVIERMRSDVDPVERGRIDRQYDIGIGNVARQGLETLFALHHIGRLPISSTVGRELA